MEDLIGARPCVGYAGPMKRKRVVVLVTTELIVK